jgi:hypothetical protein
MVEDKILVWKLNRGSKDALRRIYEKYKDDLLGLAVTLLRDRNAAADSNARPTRVKANRHHRPAVVGATINAPTHYQDEPEKRPARENFCVDS